MIYGQIDFISVTHTVACLYCCFLLACLFACLLSVRLTCIHSEHDCLLTQGFCPTRRELARSSLQAEDISMIMGAKDKYVRPTQNSPESPFNRQQVAQISHISPKLHDTIKEKRIWPAAFLFSICLLIGRECETEQQLPASCICVFCICVFLCLCICVPIARECETGEQLPAAAVLGCIQPSFDHARRVCLFVCSCLLICWFVCLFFGLFFGLLTGNLVTFSWASLQLFQMAAFV